jgi:hypothetical protein
MKKPPCPHCDAGTAPPLKMTARDVEAAAAQFPLSPSLCADSAVYEARLNCCGNCPALKAGFLCAYCGCLVQFRARPKKSHCPHPAGDRWAGIQKGMASDENRRQ